MADRFPAYDVLAKRDTPSWNEQTRTVIEERLALPERTDALSEAQRATLAAIIDRITPQPESRPPVNALAFLLDRIAHDEGDGFRPASFPRIRLAWERGLDAIVSEARIRHTARFPELAADRQDALLRAVEQGDVDETAWRAIDPKQFFHWRLLPDIVSAYWAHPSAWSAMGFGGPASPRGYVRLDANRRDPWEAAEAGDGALLPASFRNRHVG